MKQEKLKKQKKELSLKHFLIHLITNELFQISDILTEIRALKGVVTISIFEPTIKYGTDKHLTKVKLKYLILGGNFKENIKTLKKSILSLNGVQAMVIKIKKSDLDIEITQLDQGVNNVT